MGYKLEKKLEDIYVWGVSSYDGSNYQSLVAGSEKDVLDCKLNALIRCDIHPLFPIGKPQKYKLVPME